MKNLSRNNDLCEIKFYLSNRNFDWWSLKTPVVLDHRNLFKNFNLNYSSQSCLNFTFFRSNLNVDLFSIIGNDIVQSIKAGGRKWHHGNKKRKFFFWKKKVVSSPISNSEWRIVSDKMVFMKSSLRNVSINFDKF